MNAAAASSRLQAAAMLTDMVIARLLPPCRTMGLVIVSSFVRSCVRVDGCS